MPPKYEKLYTIEGNTSGASTLVTNGSGVRKKSYSMSSTQQHDTLWAIAKHFYGRGDQYIRLMEANNLKSTALKIGQVLIVPQD